MLKKGKAIVANSINLEKVEILIWFAYGEIVQLVQICLKAASVLDDWKNVTTVLVGKGKVSEYKNLPGHLFVKCTWEAICQKSDQKGTINKICECDVVL